jgi:hydrogenase maturation factor
MDVLHSLLARYGGEDERLVVGPQVGKDAAVLDMGDRYLVAKSDPITFAAEEIGWYVVHVNANDIVCMGATPRWMLLTLLLPEEQAGPEMLEEIMAQVRDACQSLGIVLCGGHTEITYGLGRPIAVGLMLGEMEKEQLVDASRVEAGDEVLLTKGVAIEGTAVLARELGSQLQDQVGPEWVSRGRRFLTDPGISVVRDAQVLCRIGRPHALHDPTEGGVATGLWELAWSAGKGIVIDPDEVHVFPETKAFCSALGLDPWGLIASGALLAVVSSAESGAMVQGLGRAGIQARVIGKVVEGPGAVQVGGPEGLVPLARFDQDELTRVLG